MGAVVAVCLKFEGEAIEKTRRGAQAGRDERLDDGGSHWPLRSVVGFLPGGDHRGTSIPRLSRLFWCGPADRGLSPGQFGFRPRDRRLSKCAVRRVSAVRHLTPARGSQPKLPVTDVGDDGSTSLHPLCHSQAGDPGICSSNLARRYIQADECPNKSFANASSARERVCLRAARVSPPTRP